MLISHMEPDSKRPAFARAFDRLIRLTFVTGMTVMLSAMTLLIGLDVILRVVASAPIRGTHDMVGLGLLMTFICALPYSWRGSHHVRMDMLYSRFPPRWQAIVDVAAGVAAILFGVLLCYQAAVYVPIMQQRGAASVTLQIPYWPFTICIMVSAGLFVLSAIQETALTLLGRK